MTRPDRPDPTALDLAHDAIGGGCFGVDLDGRVHSWVASVRDALVERGVLRCDREGIWRLAWHGFDLVRERAAWMACCDFCGARPVCWNVPCATFVLPPVEVAGVVAPEARSVGDWAACEACGAAVSDGQRAVLEQRTLRAYGHDRISRRFQRLMQRRFWAHYGGGAVRIAPKPFGH